ncbi:MAG: zinc-dependent metalloprotease [Bacteroidota bacterium]|nr:zinc-dependent metalloprotease [Bacteroidota bacterium]
MRIKSNWLLFLPFTLFCALGSFAQMKAAPPAGADTAKKPPAKPSLADKVKGSRKIEGLFTLYQDTVTGSLQIYVKKDQLGKEFIYQSFSMGGPTSLFLNQNMIRTTWVFRIRKQFDKIEFSQENTNFWYDPSNAISKAANVDVPEAIFYSDKAAAEDDHGYLIAGDGLFLSEKLDPVKPILPPGIPPQFVFNLGSLNAAKSKYDKIRSYPNNTDVVVDLAYDNPAPFNGGGRDITDARYDRIRFQHSFMEVPQNDFRPRRDDPRIGYFSEEIDNLTTIDVPNFKDVIHRWNLKKKDPGAALSEPVEPIVWWVENTTPVEYRQTIVEAGEKWNEAFEAAGFKNAVVMKIMPDTATWDPADIRYNTIRWVSSPYPPYGAIGPSFVNPKTGQILGADITVEWFSGSATPILDELYSAPGQENPYGWTNGWNVPGSNSAADPFSQFLSPSQKQHWQTCTLGQELKAQFTAGLTALEANNASPSELKEMHKQFLYYLILHEMGHTMGLNHNMKASQMLSPAEVNNTDITHKIGLQGSVMDYPAINIALDHSKQGDYYTTKPGPYDLWAIQYGYTECSPAEEDAVLSKIASRSHDPHLAFGNDADDMRTPGGGGIDPRVMINDLTNDMVTYSDERFRLINKLMTKLKDKYSKPGRSYTELRSRYGILAGQRNSMASSVSRYVGGIYVDRSYVGQGSDARPFTPVPAAYQKKAVQVLSKYVFAPDAYDADSRLFPYLQAQRRGFSFFGGTEDPKPQNTVLAIQQGVLTQVFSVNALQRMNTTSLYGNSYSVADVMGDFTKAIFDADKMGAVNLYRQNIQTEYVKKIIGISEATTGYDNPSREAAYNTLRKIKALLATMTSPNEQTRAHRASLTFLIDKALVVK